MTKDMFLKDLRRSLAVGLSSTEIEVHVKYYTEYIAMEMSNGKSEQEILDELGEPRLISKSILEAKEDGDKQFREDQKSENREEKIGRIPSWLLIVVTVIAIIIIIGLVLRVFIYLLPVLIILIAIIVIASYVRKLFS